MIASRHRTSLQTVGLALASAAFAVGTLELGARKFLVSSTGGALTHVGIDENAQNELRWRQRRRRVSAEDSILTVDPLLG